MSSRSIFYSKARKGNYTVISVDVFYPKIREELEIERNNVNFS